MRARSRWLVAYSSVLALAGVFLACGKDPATDDLSKLPSAGHPQTDAGSGSEDTGAPFEPIFDADVEDAADSTSPDLPVPKLDSVELQCKLLNKKGTGDPTLNDVQHRANVAGADLGISVAHGDDFYVFFGDTIGWSQIWGAGESHPDAVGYSKVPYSQVKQDSNVLCNNLGIMLSSFKSGDADADFAAGSMKPPTGHTINEYVLNPSGKPGANAFPTFPGDFEVPSGALSYNGAIYLYYTSSSKAATMNQSYLAKWTAPSTSGKPDYQILHLVDELRDGKGALGGDFINIAPVVVDDYLYLYGSGEYRNSSVNIVRKPIADIEKEGGYDRFDALTRQWGPQKLKGSPIVGGGKIGELSVRYYPNVGRFVMLNQEINTKGNQIVARFATQPEGPWSDAVTVMTMDADFDKVYRCPGKNDCPGDKQILSDYGFYGTYLFPEATLNADGSFTLDFLMSVFEPYNTILMRAKFY